MMLVANEPKAVRYAIDHGPRRDTNYRQSRSLRFNDGDAERLVGHARNIKIRTGKPCSEIAPIAAVAGREYPLGFAARKLLAQWAVTEQQQNCSE